MPKYHMITSDVYELLVKDILENTTLTQDMAREVVEFMESEDLLDYDLLKENYLYFLEEEDEDDEQNSN